MPKQLVFVGPDIGSRSLFIASMAIALERNNLGRIEPLHPLYGHIIDAALAEKPMAIRNLSTEYNANIYYKKKRVRLTEYPFTSKRFMTQSNDVGRVIAKSNCAVIFLDIQMVSKQQKLLGAPETSMSGLNEKALESSIKTVALPLIKWFKPWWKFFKKVKKIIFITTSARETGLDDQTLGLKVSAVIPETLGYLKKRNVKYTFHSVELLHETGGIDSSSLSETLLDDILRF